MKDKIGALFTREWLEWHERMIDEKVKALRKTGGFKKFVLDGHTGGGLARISEDGTFEHIPREEWIASPPKT